MPTGRLRRPNVFKRAASSRALRPNADRLARHAVDVASSVPLGLQHFLAMAVGNVTVPLVVASAIDLPDTETVVLLQAALMVAGVATLMQSIGIGVIGARLPIVMGTSFAFVPILVPLAQTLGLAAVFAAVFVGGLVTACVGFGLRWLRVLFPPVVTGTYVLTLGIVLMPVAFAYVGGGLGAHDYASPRHLSLAIGVIAITLFLHQYFVGLVSDLSVLLGLSFGCVAASFMGMVDLSPFSTASWLQLPSPWAFGLEFHPAAIIGMGIMALAICAAEVGNVTATTAAAAGREASASELCRGVTASGLSSSLAGVFNAFPQAIFSQNVGLVAMTGNASRTATIIAGLLLVMTGLLPKLGAIVAAIPGAALGGALVLVFGLIVSVGLKLLSRVEMDKRGMTIVGTSVAVAVGLRFGDTVLLSIPDAGLRAVLQSGLIPGTVVSIVLNLCLPEVRQDEERTTRALPEEEPRVAQAAAASISKDTDTAPTPHAPENLVAMLAHVQTAQTDAYCRLASRLTRLERTQRAQPSFENIEQLAARVERVEKRCETALREIVRDIERHHDRTKANGRPAPIDGRQ